MNTTVISLVSLKSITINKKYCFDALVNGIPIQPNSYTGSYVYAGK